MSDASTLPLQSRPRRLLAFPGLAAGAGWLMGTLAQLQQAALWPGLAYAALATLGFGLLWMPANWRVRIGWHALRWALAAALLAGALTGMRSLLFSSQQLLPALEGQDLLVTGTVQGLPQIGPDRVRFRFQTQSATAVSGGTAVVVPDLLDLAWYPPMRAAAESSRLSQSVRAGEVWRLQVRLKAPHGNHNPGAFDYELWLWQSGVQATGYVRDGARDVAPERLQPAAGAWMARARAAIRARIVAHVAEPSQAGLLAALVVGEQAAIPGADWDVFRVTGVSHLVSISGLHILICVVGQPHSRLALAAQCAPVPVLARARGRVVGRLGVGYRLCAVFRLGPARTADLPDAGNRNRAPGFGRALALALGVDAGGCSGGGG